MAAVPPWPDEDFACVDCGLRYPDLSVPAAVVLVAGVPSAARAAVADVPDAVLRRRPPAGGWSAAEYLCHLRDVAVGYTIRLHRARTEDRPVLEPMRGDLRARRFRFADADLPAVLGELTAAASGFTDEVRRVLPDGWDRSWSGCPARNAPPAGWSARRRTRGGTTSRTSAGWWVLFRSSRAAGPAARRRAGPATPGR